MTGVPHLPAAMTQRRGFPIIFTLRLWCEPLSNDQCEWRGEIRNVSTGEVRAFRLGDEIAVLIPEMLNGRSAS